MFSLIVGFVPKYCCNFQPKSNKALIAAAGVLDFVSGVAALYISYKMLNPRQISQTAVIGGCTLFLFGFIEVMFSGGAAICAYETNKKS